MKEIPIYNTEKIWKCNHCGHIAEAKYFHISKKSKNGVLCIANGWINLKTGQLSVINTWGSYGG